MNLVTCSENCRYQKDGMCTRTGAAPTASQIAGCCYYEPPEKLFQA
ncbi:MAG: hypothetical protein ACOX6P_01070 [Candidatus Merdivicinus sp.]|jgi:hypothetical protein